MIQPKSPPTIKKLEERGINVPSVDDYKPYFYLFTQSHDLGKALSDMEDLLYYMKSRKFYPEGSHTITPIQMKNDFRTQIYTISQLVINHLIERAEKRDNG